jgi:hypothetical protein
MRGEVKVQLSSIRRAWRDGGNHEFWVRLRTKSDDFGAFGDAIDRANRAEGPDGIFAQLETPAPGGFVVMAGTGHDDDPANLDRWATELGRTLEEVGLTGVLGGVSQTHLPEWTHPRGDRLAAFFRWSIDLERLTAAWRQDWRGGWHVPGDATARICEHLATWTEPGGPAIIVGQDTFSFAVSDGSTVAGTLLAAASRSRFGRVFRYVDAEKTARSAWLVANGETVLRIIDDRADEWEDRVAELRRGMTALPDILDLAFVRPAGETPFRTWSDLEIVQKLPGVTVSDVTYRARHLLSEYVPDAHGMQVLRDEHLAKARDLTGWAVSSLGHGRYLVEAHDLAPWYATPMPDPEVVERARRDFGDMILTQEVLAAHPVPWAQPRSNG